MTSRAGVTKCHQYVRQYMIIVTVLLAAFSTLIFEIAPVSSQEGSKPLVPALFIFGDSLADPGNNNHLASLAKANFPPYGNHFDTQKPTGRFCNGRTALDALASIIGLPLVPPFLDPATKGTKVLQGVNYASAGSGILDSTGEFFGQLIKTTKQLEYFRDQTLPEIYELLGEDAADKLIHESVYYIISGSNDFVNGFYFYIPTSPPEMSIDDYIQLVVDTLSQHLKFLYNLGARKAGAAGLPPLGCCPSQITRYNLTSKGCVGFLNEVSSQYNIALRKMLSDLRAELPDFNVIYNNIYDPLADAVNNPTKYGFKIEHAACCGVGELSGKFLCLPYSIPCHNPDDHIFWDYYHPTDKMYKHMLETLYYNGPPYSEPYSGQHLIEMQI